MPNSVVGWVGRWSCGICHAYSCIALCSYANVLICSTRSFVSGCTRSGKISFAWFGSGAAFLHLQTFLSLTAHLFSVRSFWSILSLGMNVRSQFSQHAFVSVTHLIPSLSLGGLPAACVYPPVLWCHLISSHTVVLWNKHGLVCLITGFHDSVGTGQKNLSSAMFGAQECWVVGNLEDWYQLTQLGLSLINWERVTSPVLLNTSYE